MTSPSRLALSIRLSLPAANNDCNGPKISKVRITVARAVDVILLRSGLFMSVVSTWNRLWLGTRKRRNKPILIELADKAIIDESSRIGFLRLRKFLGHKVEQSLKRRDDRIGNGRHSRLSQIVSFLCHGAIRDSAVLGLNADRKLTIRPIAVHPLAIRLDELPCDLRSLLNVIAARGDAAERIVQAVLGKIN